MALQNSGISRRRVLQAGLGATALFLPAPYAWVWAQSDGAMKLLRLPKIALVIGNSNYKNAPQLVNPGNDAKAISETLRQSGFEVTVNLDAGREDMAAAIRTHAQTLAARKAVGLFYFAGHGVQLAWRNYLIPVDAAVRKLDDIQATCVDLTSLIEGINKASNPMNVVILDACRENPFGDIRVESRGLSQIDAPHSTLLAYATAPGNVASDGEGANGLYTENLLREMKTPDAKIEDVFKRVRLNVRRSTKGQQIPWESTSLEEDFYFVPPKELKRLSDAEAARAFEVELAIWEKIKTSTDPAPLEEYLRRYPGGKFSELAQFQLDRVLAAQGEKKIEIASQQNNPFTAGTARVGTNFKIGDSYTGRRIDLLTRLEQGGGTLTVTGITDTEIIYNKGSLITDYLGNVITLVTNKRGMQEKMDYLNETRVMLIYSMPMNEIVVDFYDKRNFMGILAAHDSQHTKRGSNRVATAFYGEFDDIFGVEIKRIGRKRRTRTVLNALVNRENIAIARSAQASVRQQCLQTAQNLVVAVAVHPYFLDMIGGGQVKRFFINRCASMVQ